MMATSSDTDVNFSSRESDDIISVSHSVTQTETASGYTLSPLLNGGHLRNVYIQTYTHIHIEREKEMTHVHVCIYVCTCMCVCMYIYVECDLYTWIPDQLLCYISLQGEESPGDGETDWRKRAELSEKLAPSLLPG
jgi:hypothetical protein